MRHGRVKGAVFVSNRGSLWSFCICSESQCLLCSLKVEWHVWQLTLFSFYIAHMLHVTCSTESMIRTALAKCLLKLISFRPLQIFQITWWQCFGLRSAFSRLRISKFVVTLYTRHAGAAKLSHKNTTRTKLNWTIISCYMNPFKSLHSRTRRGKFTDLLKISR